MALNAEDDKPAQRRWIQLLQAPSQKTASCPSRSTVASMIASRQMGQLWVASAVDWLLAEESWWENLWCYKYMRSIYLCALCESPPDCIIKLHTNFCRAKLTIKIIFLTIQSHKLKSHINKSLKLSNSHNFLHA